MHTHTVESVILSAQLSRQTFLDLSGYDITLVPDKIKTLSFLTHLNISRNRIKDVSWVRYLPNLIYLDLSCNKISEIGELKYLVNLEKLNLWNNQLTEIGALASLKELITLDIRSNLIKNLSPILKLPKLQELDIRHNVVTDTPPEIIARGIKAVKEFHLEAINRGFEKIYEAKVLIVGEAGAGKTSLQRKLINRNASLPDINETTKGIEIVTLPVDILAEKVMYLNIWDFSGQEIYYTTHQFFLTHRSLYILVSDVRNEDANFIYWLQAVELLGENSPLIIVHNEKAHRTPDINYTGLVKEFSEILKGHYRVNLATNKGIDLLVDAIKMTIKYLPHVGTELPKSWAEVRLQIQRLSQEKNYIYFEDYLKICEVNRIDYENAIIMSQFFHDIGVFLHFKDNPLLQRLVILRNEWATEAVYSVLDNEKIKGRQGTFTFEEIKKIWNKPAWIGKEPELLELMQMFELCYTIDDRKTFIAPQLLKSDEPEVLFPNGHRIHVRYVYDFMPKGIISKFIVKMHNYIKKPSYVWKEGVVLEWKGCEAEIKSSVKKPEISVKVNGKLAKEFLVLIEEAIDKIHESFPKINFQKMIPCNCPGCMNSDVPHYYIYEKLLRRIVNSKHTVECENSYEEVEISSLIGEKSPLSTSQLKKQLRGLVASNNLGELFEKLKTLFAENSAEINKIILLESQFNEIKKNQWIGVTNQHESMNKIKAALLELIDESTFHKG